MNTLVVESTSPPRRKPFSSQASSGIMEETRGRQPMQNEICDTLLKRHFCCNLQRFAKLARLKRTK